MRDTVTRNGKTSSPAKDFLLPPPRPPGAGLSHGAGRAPPEVSGVSETGSAQPTKIMGLEAAQSQVSGENT